MYRKNFANSKWRRLGRIKSGGDFTRISVTQDGIRFENTSLLMLLRLAYGLSNTLDDKFLGLPPSAKYPEIRC